MRTGHPQELLCEEKLVGVPILVYANKQDLIGSATSAQIAEGLSLHTIKVRRLQGLRECSQMIFVSGPGVANTGLFSHQRRGGQGRHGVGVEKHIEKIEQEDC